MWDHEARLAQKLVKQLRALGVEAQVSDRRYVRAASGNRGFEVFCIWYERSVSALMLGMNQANARRSLGNVPRPREGAEYYVELLEGGVELTGDRTPDLDQVVSCARTWLVQGRALEEVERETPFVRALYRRARAVVAKLDPALRCSIGGDPSYDVWAYGDGRSCKLIPGASACSFWFGQAQVAFAELQDPSAAVSAWLVERVSITELAARFVEVSLERHADVLERDPARWHWLHLLDRAADPDDVLAPLRELIETLARRSVVTAFYSFSSLVRLCFSASSHYPWIDEGLPIVWRAGAEYIVHTYRDVGIEPVTCDLAGAVATIEQRLAASSVRPFFGSAPHHELEPLTQALERRGSSLRPALVPHGEWYHLEVATKARRCEYSGLSLKLCEDGRTRYCAVGSIDEGAEAISRFLERGESMDAIAPSSADGRPK